MNIISLKNISHKYPKGNKLALNNISFNINKGDFHALIGNNGAGKSTLIKLIIKALLLQSGQILVNDIDYNSKHNSYIISYFPDKMIFPIGFSIFKYLYCELLIVNKKDQFLKDKILKMLKMFDLLDYKDKTLSALSSGMQKKVELIRIILESPDIILLDEPTNFLDPQTRIIMYKTLQSLNAKGTTILLSTHVLDEIKEYANSATIIDTGKIKYTGPVKGNKLKEIYNIVFKDSFNKYEDEQNFNIN